MAKLSIEVESKQTADGVFVAIIKLGGVLDASTIGSLETSFNEAMEKGSSIFLFYLSNLEYISSAGVGFFMKATEIISQKEQKIVSGIESKGEVALVGASQKVRRVFDLLDLLDFFTLISEEEVNGKFKFKS